MRLDRRSKKIIVIFLITSAFISFIYFYQQLIYENKYLEEWRLLLSLNSTNECRLPLNANPFDESISRYIVKLKDRIECSSENKYYSIGPNGESLTFVDSAGVLVTAETKLNLRCIYRNFSRSESNDDKIEFSNENVLPKRLNLKKLNIEFVVVKCFDGEQLVYSNTHFFPSAVNKPPSEVNGDKPSVIILVIESLSRLNYLRFLKQTQSAFESLNNYFYLKGLTKYADNSFPNMAAMLTGLRPYYNEFPKSVNPSTGPYDDLPLIWKRFDKLNYVTAFIEDNPKITLFNYLKKGFVRKPTDWYPRPFWLHIYEEKYSNYCYNNEPKIELFFKQINQLMETTKQNPLFLYSFFIEVTHQDFNKAQLVDFHIAKFIKDKRNQLKDSIFILMGDHGNRYGAFLETPIGRIEERMPLFAMHLPDSFLVDKPHFRKYFDINSDRLTTWLDVHQVLVDISNSNYSEIKSESKKRQYSFWREEVPMDRTCDDALIPDNYCVCDQRVEVNSTETFVKNAALSLVSHINNLLSSRTNKCKQLTLDEIKSAWVLFANSVIQRNKFERKLELIIRVNPSNATFGGLLYQNYWTSNWVTRGDVSRLNKYGDQSKCIDHKILKKICFCEE